MIYIGDCHGKTEILNRKLRYEFGDKKSFQLGDMGLGFKGVLLPQYERDRFLFIRGNHDSPQWCKAHPNYAGEFGYLPEEELFFCGGAWSIDAKWRVPGISWWVDEELSVDELHQAFELYCKTKPRIVATHEAPSAVAQLMLMNIIAASGPDNVTSVAKDDSYYYYKEKLGCANTRTSQYLQQMLDVHKPEHWVFGHYHVDREFDYQGCQFHCLPELMAKEIVLAPASVEV